VELVRPGTVDMNSTCFDLPPDTGFGLDNLPYGVFSTGPGGRRVGVALGDWVIDVSRLDVPAVDTLAAPSLNPLLARGPRTWAALRTRLQRLLCDPEICDAVGAHLIPRDQVTMHLPFEVADYVDFYSSEQHAANVGRIFRPDSDPLPANWRHLPVGYHGRAGTVAVSGTPVPRPEGQRLQDGVPVFGPSTRLDLEAELGFVVGVPSDRPVPVGAFAEHVFGVCLLNDWSARDLQAWEYVPLGPFLGKSFLTSISPWVVPLAALEHARVMPPARDPGPLPYLEDDEPWGLDISLDVRLNGQTVSRPPAAGLYWTAAQQLAHLTVNGATLRTGDLYGSGTVSGAERDQRGSLLELSWGGSEPLELADGSTRTFLEDGDEVTITATAPGADGGRIGFGEVTGKVVP
jgi:fumarylacetoacetase